MLVVDLKVVIDVSRGDPLYLAEFVRSDLCETFITKNQQSLIESITDQLHFCEQHLFYQF